jgi:hypothetical protein
MPLRCLQNSAPWFLHHDWSSSICLFHDSSSWSPKTCLGSRAGVICLQTNKQKHAGCSLLAKGLQKLKTIQLCIYITIFQHIHIYTSVDVAAFCALIPDVVLALSEEKSSTFKGPCISIVPYLWFHILIYVCIYIYIYVSPPFGGPLTWPLKGVWVFDIDNMTDKQPNSDEYPGYVIFEHRTSYVWGSKILWLDK